MGELLLHEPAVRLGFFVGVFAAMALWELLAPRRALGAVKAWRWANNLGIVFLNTALVRVLFPTTAVALALSAEAQGWGVLNHLDLHASLEIVAALVALDFAIWLQHVTFHAVPALWRLHRVHHPVEEHETNSNFGFNLSLWDRLFGTYKAQPDAGHERMTIGIRAHRDEREVERMPGMLALPLRGAATGYAINRRTWARKA